MIHSFKMSPSLRIIMGWITFIWLILALLQPCEASFYSSFKSKKPKNKYDPLEDPNSPYYKKNPIHPPPSFSSNSIPLMRSESNVRKEILKRSKEESKLQSNPTMPTKRFEFLQSVKAPFQIRSTPTPNEEGGGSRLILPGFSMLGASLITSDNSHLFLGQSDFSKAAIQSTFPFQRVDMQVEATLRYEKKYPMVSTHKELPWDYGFALWWSLEPFPLSTSKQENAFAMNLNSFQGVMVMVQPLTLENKQDYSQVQIQLRVSPLLLPEKFVQSKQDPLVLLDECTANFRNHRDPVKLRLRYTSRGLSVETELNGLQQPCILSPVQLLQRPKYFTLSAQNNGKDQSDTIELIELALFQLNVPSSSNQQMPPRSSSFSSSSSSSSSKVIPSTSSSTTESNSDSLNKEQITSQISNEDSTFNELKSTLNNILSKLNTFQCKDPTDQLQRLQKTIFSLNHQFDTFIEEQEHHRSEMEEKIDELLQVLTQKVGSHVNLALKKHTEQTVQWLQEKSHVSTTSLFWFIVIQCTLISMYSFIKRKFKFNGTKKYL